MFLKKGIIICKCQVLMILNYIGIICIKNKYIMQRMFENYILATEAQTTFWNSK